MAHPASAPLSYVALAAGPTGALAPLRSRAQVADGLRVEVLRGAQAFDLLEDPWRRAVERMARPSLFVTPEFLRLSWQHLQRADDEPWFVAVWQGAEMVGLLPLVLRRCRHARLPFRILRHMGMLAGDRPGLVHTLEADRVWPLMLQAVVSRRAAWDLLELQELDEGDWPLGGAAMQALARHRGLQVSAEVDTHAGYLRIEGTWEAYLQGRSRNARQGFVRRERQLREAHPDVAIERVDDPQQIVSAFDRYLAIEAAGWKSRQAVGLWSDPREPDFHRALLRDLAGSARASVWLLTAGGVDIAGLVRLRQGSVVYERHSTFHPDYARYSPSTYLCMQAVRALFGSDCAESDVLGMREPMEQRPAIHAWYPGVRVTRRLQVLNPPLLYRPLLALRAGLVRLRNRVGTRRAADTPAPQAPRA